MIVPVNDCGSLPAGKSREALPCNQDPCQSRDCQWQDWSVWGHCSCDCGGTKTRSRHIGQYGKGAGTFCEGAGEQTEGCDKENKTCHTTPAPAVDCVFGDWNAWSSCEDACNGGAATQSNRVRVLVTGGGKVCAAKNLTETRGCDISQCDGPKSCEFSGWSEWGECLKCAGQKKRHRTIMRMPEDGGESCKRAMLEDEAKCPLHSCHSVYFCSWQDWSAWSSCSVTCGLGHRKRKRSLTTLGAEVNGSWPLEAEAVPRFYDAQATYESLEEEAQRMGSGRIQDAIASFSFGGLTVLVAMLVRRTWLAASDDGEEATTVAVE